jgi:REP element-mobilizing transposase RayT
VATTGNPRFLLKSIYHRYLDCLHEATQWHDCERHAYVLMTNHVHLLVTPRKPLAIAKLIGALAAEVMAQAAVRVEWTARGIAGLPSAVDLN